MISFARILLASLMLMLAWPAFAQENDPDAITPLRLSYLEGDVGFWRYGAEDWTDARLNTPLAAGDALYVDGDGTLELQFGSRAFIRASDDTELSVVNQTSDFLQVKVTSGRVSFDLRALPAGTSIELNTPNAVFTLERAGYYRVEVDDEVRFITRRGGQATMVPAGGSAMSIYPSEEIVVEGTHQARAETYVAPELDGWDRWNYDRTEDIIDTASQRYLSSEIAGAEDLDRYGRWRVVPQYGTVWVPDGLHAGWAPYTTGRWVWDPYYQWTWIDDSPWGWAPYHYGRWVYVSGYWAWAPGPVVRRAVYSPALVAFYGVGSGVSITIGGSIGWVALSWGEPLIPWWGRPHFVGRPYWGGWGGPRIVNNVVVKNITQVNVTNIQYVNTRVEHALVAVPGERFGKGYVQTAPAPVVQTQKKTLVRGALPIKPTQESTLIGSPGKVRVPEKALQRPVVATRPPREQKVPWATTSPKTDARIVKPDSPDDRLRSRREAEKYVTVPKRSTQETSRPQFGERAGDERPRPQQPPRYNERRTSTEPLEQRAPAQREEGARQARPLREFQELKETPEPREQPPIQRNVPEPGSRMAVPDANARSPREEAPVRTQRAPQSERAPAPQAQERAPQSQEPRSPSGGGLQTPTRGNSPAPAQIERGNGRSGNAREESRSELPGNAANRVYRGAEKKQMQGPQNERGR